MQMKIYLFSALLALIALPVDAYAATFACQYTHAGGLDWNGSDWEPKKFKLKKPFFLSTRNGVVTEESANNATDSVSYRCHKPSDEFSLCVSRSAGTIVFNEKLARGSISNLFGSIFGPITPSDNYRDSLAVAVFTCQKMSE